MVYLHSSLFWLHIVFGSFSLILFWVPLFTKKGSLNHVKFGTYFKTSMYIVAAAGVLMSALVMVAPLTIKHEYANHQNAKAIAESLRIFWGFLGLLGILTFVTTRHGIAVLEVKQNIAELRKASYLLPVFLLLVCGGIYIFLGMFRSNLLHMIFGIISALVAGGVLKYCFQSELKPRAWIIEHLGSLTGSGIAAYTAFLTFGSRRLLDLGEYQLIVGLAPGIIGTIISYAFSKKYRRVFSVDSNTLLMKTK